MEPDDKLRVFAGIEGLHSAKQDVVEKNSFHFLHN
jgi:hypothetical protein